MSRAACAVRVAALTVAVAACGGPPPLEDDGVWYRVVAGDTVEGIARRTGVPAADIIEANGLVNPDRIEVGQRLFLYGLKRLLKHRPTASRAASPSADAPPWQWPVSTGVVSSGFGQRWGRLHAGLDIAADEGTPVFAAAAGEVVYAADSDGGYGQLVILKHGENWATVYAHLSAILIDEGGEVMQGAPIAEVGSTGRSTGPHLHFEMRRDGEPVDPIELLPNR